MKNLLLIVLLVLSFTLIVIFQKSINRYENYTESLVKQSVIYSQKNKYLIRCMEYHSIINEHNICRVKNCNFLVYYTGHTCSSCVESLLLMLNEDYGLENKVTVLLDNNKKEEFILNLNDGFRLNYKYFLIQKNTSVSINDVLLIKMRNERIINILEYRPNEKFLFKEYFKRFGFMENT